MLNNHTFCKATNGTGIYGTVAYVITRAAALHLTAKPIVSPTDIELTYHGEGGWAPRWVCGPASWLAWPKYSFNKGPSSYKNSSNSNCQRHAHAGGTQMAGRSAHNSTNTTFAAYPL